MQSFSKPPPSSCNCSDDGSVAAVFWFVEIQKLSDLLISLAYFSIPIQIFNFISCSTLSVSPFKWILAQFGSFIVFCALTHLLTIFTYPPYLPSYRLILTLTVLKFLTAVVSCATSVTLISIIPRMLKQMIREGMLIKKTKELDQMLRVMRKREEASRNLTMLTREIRNSLDRHNILYTTLVQLSKVLLLDNCAVWMPDKHNLLMNLTHELNKRDYLLSIPANDPEMRHILGEKGIKFLKSNSKLGRGPGIAIRVPLLRVLDVKSRRYEMVEESYAVLVLVLKAEESRYWSLQELEIVEAVTDQVAVALSHSAVLEESLLIAEKLTIQNIALKKTREMALMEKEAIFSFRRVMSRNMITPNRSILAILSVLQTENFKSEQQVKIVNTMVKGGLLLSALLEDATCTSRFGGNRIELKLSNFSLHSMLDEFVLASKYVCAYWGLDFDFYVDKKVPDRVIGDEIQILQVLFYMVEKVIALGNSGRVVLNVCLENGFQDSSNAKYYAWKRALSEEFAHLRFEVSRTKSGEEGSRLFWQGYNKFGNEGRNQRLKFNVYEKLAELMHGSLSIRPTAPGLHMSMTFTIRLQRKDSDNLLITQRFMEPESPFFLLKGMNVLILDSNSLNRSITRKLLENLGCHLTLFTSRQQCSEFLCTEVLNYHLILIDLSMIEEEGSEMLDWIRKLKLDGWLLVVALALKADRDTRDWCLQNGFHMVICKPIILQELEEELVRNFQHSAH